tara:strand:- start:264 stop:599 length:336 start_codon:yes stop_codon:yes gene_type:complete
MREPTTIELEYLRRLTRHILQHVVHIEAHGIKWVIQEDYWLGTIYLVGGRNDVYATPGWEGEWLPMQAWDEDKGDYDDGADRGSPSTFTGDVQIDTDIWIHEVRQYIESFV